MEFYVVLSGVYSAESCVLVTKASCDGLLVILSINNDEKCVCDNQLCVDLSILTFEPSLVISFTNYCNFL